MALSMNSKFAVLDLETTGFSPYDDEITEVGVVFLDGETQERVGAFNALVNTDKNIPKRVEEITGINNELLDKNGLPLNVVGDYLREALKGCVVVCHNVQFDLQFLATKFSIEPEYFIDTLVVAQDSELPTKNNQLGTLAEHFSIDLENAHRALDDAEATAELFLNLVKDNETAKKYINTLKNNKRGISYRPKNTRQII